MYKIINLLKKNTVELNKKCVKILLDCMPNKKIINMTILCAITMVLNNLNIKYSICLFGEEEFKIIMKQFDEEHSIFILQKVYECLMMKRYRTNLANVVYFAKTSTKFIGENNKSDFYKNHPEQIIFIISDGLDEELKCIHQWKILIKDKSIKYGFIFNLPDKIEESLKNCQKKYYKYLKKSEESIINILDNDNDSNFGLYDDNFSILSDDSFYSNYSAASPINKNNFDEDNVDEVNLKLILGMWKSFIEQNKSNLRTTLIYSKEGKLDDKSIKIFSIDFAYLICSSEYKNEKQAGKTNIELTNNNPILLENFDFIKNIKYQYKLEEKPYINITDLKIKNLIKYGDISSQKYSYLNEIKGKILKSKISNKYLKKEFNNFLSNQFFSESENDIYTKKMLDYIFIPNKACQKVLSTSGSEIDINAFFLHYLSRDPEPMFYLEEKGGYIKKYSVSIIIDISKSVMNDFNKGHSFAIIKTFFIYLRFVDVPYLDVIVATGGNPIILCCGLSSRKIFAKESDFWIGLIDCLCRPKMKTYLSPSIDIAFYLNMERINYSNYLFVLTDGLFDEEENNNILENISKCIQFNFKIFGIGLGFYPFSINYLFPNVVYAKSPEKLFNAISYFFDKNIEINNKKLTPLLRDVSSNYSKTISSLMNSKENTITGIKELLQNKFAINYLIYENYNEPRDIKDMKNTFTALNDPSIQLLKKNSLKGQKILIVMLWTYELNPTEENKRIMPGNLFESGIANQPVDSLHPSKNKLCVETAVNYLGAEIYVVMNYKNANYELLRTINGKCPYYCVWIISGFDKCILPDKNADPNLLDEFMNIIHLYSSQGGSLVLFGESDPLFFQANLFLENHEFPSGYGNVKIKTGLRLTGNHKGKKTLFADKTGYLCGNQKFNAKEEISYPNTGNVSEFNNPAVKRPNLGNNLKKIYEGETISYALPHSIYPFTKFAVDSEGGISIAIYMGKNGHGDVIVDGGFTKCFLNMEEDGTYIYLRNLAAFTLRIECNFNKVVKPKKIDYIVRKVYQPIKTFKRKIFIIDSDINLYNLFPLQNYLEKLYVEGDAIFISNSGNYRKSLNEFKNMKKFIPNLSFNNNIIIEEINKLEEGLYNEFYIIDIGEQKRHDYKLGDLLIIMHNIKYDYEAIHSSFLYDKKYTIKTIKNLNIKIYDLDSFNNNYVDIRNYAYGTIHSENEDEKKELREILLKVKNFLSYEGVKIKYKILEFRLNCRSYNSDLPIAADKHSK